MMGQKHHTKSTGKWKQLSEKERYQIEILLKEKRTVKEIGNRLGKDRRTIEREIARGSVVQRDSEWRERMCYCANAGQRICEENAANKGRPLKIGHAHRLAAHIDKKIGKEQYAPDAVIGEIRSKGLKPIYVRKLSITI